MRTEISKQNTKLSTTLSYPLRFLKMGAGGLGLVNPSGHARFSCHKFSISEVPPPNYEKILAKTLESSHAISHEAELS